MIIHGRRQVWRAWCTIVIGWWAWYEVLRQAAYLVQCRRSIAWWLYWASEDGAWAKILRAPPWTIEPYSQVSNNAHGIIPEDVVICTDSVTTHP